MRRLALKTGGRPRSLDDLQILQNLADKSGSVLLKGRGAYILSGCQVTGLSIAPGFVYIDGTIIEFAGATVSSFPAYVKAAAPIEDTVLPYEDGTTRPTQTLSTVEIVYQVPLGAESIPFTTGGGRTYFDAISDGVVLTRGNQIIAGLKSFSEKIVSAGISLVDEIAAIKAPGWVSTSRIADGAVTTPKLLDYSVSTAKLGDAAVTTGKISDGVVNTAKLSNQSVTEAKLANGSVSTDKVVNGSITSQKLASDVNVLFGGNGATSTRAADWRSLSSQISSKNYGPESHGFAKTRGLRPYVKIGFYGRRDSGGVDMVECQLQRSSSPIFTGYTTISTRTFRFDSELFFHCTVDAVDSDLSTSGTYYYRLACRNVDGGANYFSNAYEAIIFSVPY